MKRLFLSLAICGAALTAGAQDTTARRSPDPALPVLVAEASCGQCNFQLPGKSCDLAVRLDGKAYFVEGTRIDDHGDAHAEEGFCNAIRKARVQGSIRNGRFHATFFELLPKEKK